MSGVVRLPFVVCLLVVSACAGSDDGERAVITDDEHLDVLSIAVHADSLDLAIDHAAHPDLLEPERTIVRLPASSQTRIATSTSFLGMAGDPVWRLGGGWTVRGARAGDLLEDVVTIRLLEFEGPGLFALWRFEGSGQPNVHLTSAEPMPQSFDVRHNAHAHRLWSFTAPGVYTMVFAVTATRRDGLTLTTGPRRYTFEVEARSGEPMD